MTLSESLAHAIAQCIRGEPILMTVLKAYPESAGSVSQCATCGNEQRTARLDIGLGEHFGLVVESVAGEFCWTCGTGVLHDNGIDLRRRLEGFHSSIPGTLTPSLLYDTPPHPRSIQMEITTRCNLKCEYCSHRLFDEKADLSLSTFVRQLDRIDFTGVENVDFTGLGEPALHPNLPDMIRLVRERGNPQHLRMVTNGTILTPARFEPLCEAGITSIAFSIDSLDSDRFARNRGGADLKTILSNLEKLAEHRAKKGLKHLRIKIKSVLTDEPYGEAERLLAYSARLGLEMPHFSCLDSRDDVQQLYGAPWLQNEWPAGDRTVFSAWAELRWKELTKDRAPELESGRNTYNGIPRTFTNAVLQPEDVCRWAVDAAFIASSGHCLSCCEQMIDIPRRRWSTLTDSSLADLWTGELFWAYRLPLAVGVVPEGCVGCTSAPAHGIPMSSIADR